MISHEVVGGEQGSELAAFFKQHLDCLHTRVAVVELTLADDGFINFYVGFSESAAVSRLATQAILMPFGASDVRNATVTEVY